MVGTERIFQARRSNLICNRQFRTNGKLRRVRVAWELYQQVEFVCVIRRAGLRIRPTADEQFPYRARWIEIPNPIPHAIAVVLIQRQNQSVPIQPLEVGRHAGCLYSPLQGWHRTVRETHGQPIPGPWVSRCRRLSNPSCHSNYGFSIRRLRRVARRARNS